MYSDKSRGGTTKAKAEPPQIKTDPPATLPRNRKSNLCCVNIHGDTQTIISSRTLRRHALSAFMRLTPRLAHPRLARRAIALALPSRAPKGHSSQCSRSEPIARPERITWLASPPLANHVAVFVSCHALQTERPRWLVRTLNNLVLLLSMRAASAVRYSAQHRTDSQCLAHTRNVVKV